MKKTFKVLSSLLFFLFANFLCIAFFASQNFILNKSFAFETKRVFEIKADEKIFRFEEDEVFENQKLSSYQKELRNQDISKVLSLLGSMGFSKKEAIEYVFPETKNILNKLKNSLNINPEGETIFVCENSCEIFFEEGKSGLFVDEIEFYEKFCENIKTNSKKISFEISTKTYDFPKIKRSDYFEKSCFSTNFETSSAERKNNIRVALKQFDGLVLEEGEVLSFNAITGKRDAEAGYKQAKIISGGTFKEGFGGGVCQVSTTLYNACLLSGLEILEVHNHSLPVSYIEPSFDAMVNIGSSDLVIRNNSGGRLIFTTSSKGDICKVKIFGKPNKFKITRHCEKTKIIPAENEEVITDPKKAEEFGVVAGSEKRISFAKDGFCSNGYLNFYNSKGELVKTKKIRSNTYNPTRGIVIKNAG